MLRWTPLFSWVSWGTDIVHHKTGQLLISYLIYICTCMPKYVMYGIKSYTHIGNLKENPVSGLLDVQGQASFQYWSHTTRGYSSIFKGKWCQTMLKPPLLSNSINLVNKALLLSCGQGFNCTQYGLNTIIHIIMLIIYRNIQNYTILPTMVYPW